LDHLLYNRSRAPGAEMHGTHGEVKERDWAELWIR
jgi:hypothetical protein